MEKVLAQMIGKAPVVSVDSDIVRLTTSQSDTLSIKMSSCQLNDHWLGSVQKIQGYPLLFVVSDDTVRRVILVFGYLRSDGSLDYCAGLFVNVPSWFHNPPLGWYIGPRNLRWMGREIIRANRQHHKEITCFG